MIGPLVFDAIRYPWSESIRNQAIGLEAVTLALVVPWALAAAVLNLGGHRLGPVLAVPPGSYAAYMMVQYIVGPNYLEYRAVVILHLAIFIAGMAAAVFGWTLQRGSAFNLPLSRRYALIPVGLALFVVSRYVTILTSGATGEPLADEFVADPAMYWSIVLLDLGIVVPAASATAIALWLSSANAARALYSLLGWFVLVPVSVASMAIVMVVNNDSNKSLPGAVFLSLSAAVFAAFAAWVHLRLTRPTP